MRKFLYLGMIVTLSACSAIEKQAATPGAAVLAVARLMRGDAEVGTATLEQRGANVSLTLSVTGLKNGEYGMHLHQIGQCIGPDYKSAGAHWNPGGRQHGLNNPQGAHAGDLPNLVSIEGKPTKLTRPVAGLILTGPGGLIDSDGAALVIHAKADDGLTDPTGNSGDRMICGKFELQN